MKTFIFVEKNGHGSFACSGTDYEDALRYLEGTVLDATGWRYSHYESDGDDDDE